MIIYGSHRNHFVFSDNLNLNNGKIALFMLHTHLRLLYNKDFAKSLKIMKNNKANCFLFLWQEQSIKKKKFEIFFIRFVESEYFFAKVL